MSTVTQNIALLLSVLLLLAGRPVHASPYPLPVALSGRRAPPFVQSSDPTNGPCPDYCKGTRFANATFVCGDPRLGPVQLPLQVPINVTTTGYDRFGGLCPGAFLYTWYNDTAGSFVYPGQQGFLITTTHAALRGETTLRIGTLLDRFGSEHGTFLAPYGTPYEQRALPPVNLAASPAVPAFPYNYHVYQVMRPLKVLAGPVAPWFGQPGLGTQFQTAGPVEDLVAGGMLRRVTLDELVDGFGQPR